MARKKPGDALKAKQKKQKIFVAIGLVALLGAGAYEVPMFMGGGEAAPPPPAATTAAPVTAAPQATPTSLAPPTPGSTPAPATSVGVGQLVDTDLAPQATQTSLIGFSLFRSKDPFVQQISPTATDPATISGSAADPSTGAAASTPPDASATGGAATGGDASSGSGSSSGNGAATGGSAPGSFVPTTGSGSTGSSGATQTGETVTVSVNGKQEAVGKGGTFPQAAPTFRLVSFGKSTAEIGIVGGSYAAGNRTVTLKQGVPLTLVNTLDDTRYRIILVRTP